MKTTHSPNRFSILMTLLILGWLTAVVAGMVALEHYSSRPGAVGLAPAQWPRESAIETANGRAQFLMFMHPQCPCSQASLSELERLVTKSHETASFTVVVVLCDGADEDWERTSLVERARSMKFVNVFIDHQACEAARFDARTSGQVLIYDASNKLTYCGGITGARGHEGGNRGADCALDCMLGKTPDSDQCSTYGCPLISPKEKP